MCDRVSCERKEKKQSFLADLSVSRAPQVYVSRRKSLCVCVFVNAVEKTAAEALNEEEADETGLQVTGFWWEEEGRQ